MEKRRSNLHGERLAEWSERGTVGTPPRPAATVVLLRDAEPGLETLMLRKNSKIAFGGMWVFPGGRIDPQDRAADDRDELAGARRAAVREALEEAGLVVEEAGLVPFSHWTPPPITPKRYITWFFVARAPKETVSIDGGEIHEHDWMRPADALARRDAGEIELAPPTFVSLYELAQHASVDDALAHARARTPERFATAVARVEGGAVAMWHGDAGYEARAPDRPGARHRLWMLDAGWRYERSDRGGSPH
jgi:8-oxo-dGTP pyrophosphatase MutT (NUDIX family)